MEFPENCVPNVWFSPTHSGSDGISHSRIANGGWCYRDVSLCGNNIAQYPPRTVGWVQYRFHLTIGSSAYSVTERSSTSNCNSKIFSSTLGYLHFRLFGSCHSAMFTFYHTPMSTMVLQCSFCGTVAVTSIHIHWRIPVAPSFTTQHQEHWWEHQLVALSSICHHYGLIHKCTQPTHTHTHIDRRSTAEGATLILQQRAVSSSRTVEGEKNLEIGITLKCTFRPSIRIDSGQLDRDRTHRTFTHHLHQFSTAFERSGNTFREKLFLCTPAWEKFYFQVFWHDSPKKRELQIYTTKLTHEQ